MGQIFIEVFSGTGRLAAALRARNMLVLEWDILNGPLWDLTRRDARRALRGSILAGHVWGLHMGTPCSSFSRARDRGPPRQPGVPSYPCRLRSDTEPWGMCEVWHPKDRAAIDLGNSLARFSHSLALLARHMSLPLTVENPAGSRLWALPPFASMLRWPHSHNIVTHFCAWGTCWQKPTRVWGLHVSLTSLEHKCSGRATCSFTGHAHQGLSGRSPQGPFWTKVAEGYPRRLCRAWGDCFMQLHGACLSAKRGAAGFAAAPPHPPALREHPDSLGLGSFA